MATITASTFTLGHAQVDGRRYVIEHHTDNIGVVHQVEYLADTTADYKVIMSERALQIALNLNATESE